MREFKRILVATDYSECSLLALARAWELAQCFDGEVDVLHVYEVPGFASDLTVGYSAAATGETLVAMLRHEAQKGMKQFLKRSWQRGVLVNQDGIIEGDPATAILEAARQGDYDLIAVGTHGRTGLPRVLMGSVAERVLRRADRPVLAVREPVRTKAA